MNAVSAVEVPLSKIKQTNNSRLNYKEKDLSTLMVQLKQTGLLQPIGVMGDGNGGYEVLWGHRRTLAAKKLGWKTIPAFIKEPESKGEALLINVQENTYEAPSMLEQSATFKAMIKEGLTKDEVATRLGIPVSRVTDYINASNTIPVEYRDKVAHNVPGKKKKAGKIQGAAAVEIENAKRSGFLTQKQARTLYDKLLTGEANTSRVKQVLSAIKRGAKAEDAIAAIGELRVMALAISVNASELKRAGYYPGSFTAEARKLLKAKYPRIVQ